MYKVECKSNCKMPLPINNGKSVNESAIWERRIENPVSHLQGQGLFGGSLLAAINQIALEVAAKHAQLNCEVRSMDFVRVIAPIKRNDVIYCSAAVTRTWPELMEVRVLVAAEDLRLLEKRDVLSSYFIIGATDEMGRSLRLPRVIPETTPQRRQFINAERRRLLRMRQSSLSCRY